LVTQEAEQRLIEEEQRRDEERLAREQERLKAAYDKEQRKERKTRDSVVEASSQDVVAESWSMAKQQSKLRRSLEVQHSIKGMFV
jgi:hypothetical protein